MPVLQLATNSTLQYQPMLEHLMVDDEDGVQPVKRVNAKQLLAAQHATSDWLKDLGAPGEQEVIAEQQKAAARQAFAALVLEEDDRKKKEALLRIKSPKAFEKVNDMLDTYDWEWVERAKSLRSLAVTKILKETEHHDARVRLRALELLGKVTEVSLFTDKIKIEQPTVGDHELETRIKDKLERYLKASGRLEDVEDVKLIEKGGSNAVIDTGNGEEDGGDAPREILGDSSVPRGDGDSSH